MLRRHRAPLWRISRGKVSVGALWGRASVWLGGFSLSGEECAMGKGSRDRERLNTAAPHGGRVLLLPPVYNILSRIQHNRGFWSKSVGLTDAPRFTYVRPTRFARVISSARCFSFDFPTPTDHLRLYRGCCFLSRRPGFPLGTYAPCGTAAGCEYKLASLPQNRG